METKGETVMKKMKRIAVSLVIALTMLLSTAFSVSAAAPSIEEIEHKGNGRVEVEFYGKVRYKRAKVIVKDNKGKEYKGKGVIKDDDDINFTIKNYKRGRTYKVTIKGVKARGTSKYGKRTAKITIPKSGAATAITSKKAIEIAKNNATKTWGAINFTDGYASLDWDDGRKIWDVKFYGYINGMMYEFDYDIAVNGGRILDFDMDND